MFAPSCGSWVCLGPSLGEASLVNLCFLRWARETKCLLDVFLGELETGNKLESWPAGTNAGCQRMFALSTPPLLRPAMPAGPLARHLPGPRVLIMSHESQASLWNSSGLGSLLSLSCVYRLLSVCLSVWGNFHIFYLKMNQKFSASKSIF